MKVKNVSIQSTVEAALPFPSGKGSIVVGCNQTAMMALHQRKKSSMNNTGRSIGGRGEDSMPLAISARATMIELACKVVSKLSGGRMIQREW